MAQVTDKQPSVLRSLDWWTIIIYVALLCFGWISVCGASYTYGDNDIFSLGARSGMQIVWIGTSIALGFVLLMLDNKFYDTFAYVIYMVLLLLLFATIFNPHEIKGSRSWLVLGPLRLQPAGVRQVCHCPCRGEIHERLWFRHTPLARLRHCLRHRIAADALHRGTEGNGFCIGIPVFLPDVLS